MNRINRSIVVLLFITCFVIAGTSHAKPDRPNFILINIDDLGYGDIEPFGSVHHRTPHLNRMAREGRKLTSHYAAPVCSPSRAAMMTGCYPKRVLPIAHVLFPGEANGLHQDETTIAEILKGAGYSTACVGKWHLGDQSEFLPQAHGFQHYVGLPYSNDMGPAADGVKSNLGAPIPKPRNNRPAQPPLPLLQNQMVLRRVLPEDQQSLVKLYTHEAVSFLWDHRDEPFFLYLPHSAVHFPLYPGEDFRGKSQNGLFGDWVEEVDWSVGQILETVRQLGLSEKTLVVFTSDNGGAIRHGATNSPLRGGKGSTWEGGIRVGTLAWWPGQIPAGTESSEITSHMDFLPTMARLAGENLPDGIRIDGGDIWPILSGQPDASSPYDAFLYFRGLNLQAVRQGPWKLHLRTGQLYHLEDDLGESVDVAGANESIVKRLRAIATGQDQDLGRTGIGPGCRKLGVVESPRSLIGHDGNVRKGFQKPSVSAGQGIMLGELTSSSVLVQVRLTRGMELEPNAFKGRDGGMVSDLAGAPGTVEFTLEQVDNRDAGPVRQSIAVDPDRDYIARVKFDRLKPGTSYRIKTRIGSDTKTLVSGPDAAFHTLPGRRMNQPVRFAVVTGMNHAKFHGDDRIDRALHLKNNNTALPAPYGKPDKHLGYPALETIRRSRPAFFIGTGDNVYYDTPPGDKFRAQEIHELRQKWHEQFVQPRFRKLFSVVPTYWMVDDHDYRIDDCDNSGDYRPSPETGRRLMLEQLPYGLPDDGAKLKTYRTVRVNEDLQIWLTENRLYRSPNSMEDGPGKSIWGSEQKKWLYRTLAESDARFKVLISPTPLVGPDDRRKTDNHTNINGFRFERDEFFQWLRQSGIGKQFVIVCGDRHWQYHATHPAGVDEYSCGALVDPNSRLGRKPGDPASTDPQGRIVQHYSQLERSGGYLEVESSRDDRNRPRLTFTFHDEHGVELYSHSR